MVVNPEQPKVECPYCSKEFCHACKVPWHDDSTCAQYQQWKADNADIDASFEQWARANNAMKCPACTVMVIRSAGCNCMRCHSPACAGRTEFCYRCGELLPKGHDDFRSRGGLHPCPLFG